MGEKEAFEICKTGQRTIEKFGGGLIIVVAVACGICSFIHSSFHSFVHSLLQQMFTEPATERSADNIPVKKMQSPPS